ncbi:MAG: hypothetical protein GEU71_02610 [Actinobacteria bacterium]|jgi:hypothetical protein|nr:hypothetical protein [Actinomycetota bacterium]
MTDSITGAAAVLVAVLFGWAAVNKIARRGRWIEALSGYQLPAPLVRFFSIAVPLAEVSIVVLMLSGRTKVGGAAAVVLLSSFSGAIVRARAARGDRLPCGCFGGNRTLDFKLMLMRNALIGALAAITLFGPGVSVLSDWDPPAGGELVPFILVLIGAGLFTWLGRAAAVALGAGRRS